MADTNLNTLLQSMLEGMILQDKEGRIIQFNQAALDILGVSEDQLTTEMTTSSEGQDKIFPGKNHIGMISFKTGEAQKNIIINIIRADGEMRWISLNAAPVFDKGSSEPSQLVNTFIDITEVKKVSNDLKQAEFIFNISHDLIIITNQQGYFKKINPRFSEVLGHSLQGIISQKYISFVHPDDLELTKAKLTQLLEIKKSIHFINRYKTKDGSYRIFDWVVVTDLETNLFYFTARDISDYREEELSLIHSSKVYSIGEMTGCVTFIIHNHLAVIANNLDFIQNQIKNESVDPSDLKNKIQSIEESVERLAKITQGLASFSKNTEDEVLIDTTLEKALVHVLTLCKERCRIHSVKLNIDLGVDLFIRCREGQIAQAFITILNVLYNEVHLQRDALIELNTRIDGELVVVTISNNAPKDLINLQKNFNIPQKIIEDNFGKLFIDELDPYTKIRVEFPLIKNK